MLAHGNVPWIITKAEEKKLLASEMEFIKRIAGYTLLDHKQKYRHLSSSTKTQSLHLHKITELI
jgi:hypothetical protein